MTAQDLPLELPVHGRIFRPQEGPERDERGRLRMERDYRTRTDGSVQGGIYLQGGTEHTHGLTSSLLSNGAVRAGEIRDSILTRRHAPDTARDYALRA